MKKPQGIAIKIHIIFHLISPAFCYYGGWINSPHNKSGFYNEKLLEQ
jgi:hypothetical protein